MMTWAEARSTGRLDAWQEDVVQGNTLRGFWDWLADDPEDPTYRCPECDTYSGAFTPQGDDEMFHGTCGRVGPVASFIRGTPEYEDAYARPLA